MWYIAMLLFVSRTTVAPWIPAMMLYLIGIYSGSVALSKLVRHVFCFIRFINNAKYQWV